MTEYVTVFQSTPPDFSWFTMSVSAILLGALVMAVFAAMVSFHRGFGFTHQEFVAGIALIGIPTMIAMTFGMPQKLVAITAGTVTDFQPMPYGGQAVECFKVAGRRFCYSDYTPGSFFHNAASHGGPVRAGQPVRVTHLGDEIYRLEIAKGFVPSAASRAVAADLAKQKDREEIRDSPVHRGIYIGGLTFALAVTGLMSWWWKRAYRLWFQEPDGSLTPVLFRLFVGLNFCGAASELARRLQEQPPTLQSAGVAIFILVLSGVFAAYMFRGIEKSRRSGNK